MAILNLVFGPDPIFEQKASKVTTFDNKLQQKLSDMTDTLYHHKALGIGANMLGILEQLVVVDIQESGKKQLYKLVNPEITSFSDETSVMMEASLSFPGIKAKIKRPANIELIYYDEFGVKKNMSAAGLLARVIQHEIDYLNGKTFLDYLSPTKRKMLILKIKR